MARAAECLLGRMHLFTDEGEPRSFAGTNGRLRYTPRMATQAKDAVRPIASNKRARHDYHVLETYEAGLKLSGTEVKAVRTGKIQLKDSYIEFKDSQAFLVGAHISHYSHGNRENHEPEAVRKLLLKKREIDRLFGRTQLKGLTVVPLSVYLKGNWIKVEIALVQGKKLYDKREAEKTRELDREVEAAVKGGRW
jgi:SsrA-binding protein